MSDHYITSDDNSKLKLVRKLRTRKHREELGIFAAEGSNLVYEAIDRGADIDFILMSEAADAAHTDRLNASGADIYIVSQRTFDRLTDAQNGIDLIAVVRRPDATMRRLDAVVAPGDNILILDRVQDPGNIGSLIRTAAAAGYRAVICIKGTGDVYSPKVLRATAGMIYALPVVYAESAVAAAQAARRLGKLFAVTVPTGGTEYYRLDLRHDVALVIGNEGNGVSEEILREAELLVTIPMAQGVESLNAAISGSIIMYESIRSHNQ